MRIITTDLYESSFLNCSGIELAEVWLDQGRLHNTVVFAFDGNYQLEELQKSYRTGNGIVNLADYRHSLNRLRDMMFELLKNKNNEQKTIRRRSISATRQGRNRVNHENIHPKSLSHCR